MEFSFDSDELTRAVLAIGDVDLTPVMPAIAQILISSVEENFLVGGRYQVVGGEYTGGTQKWKQSKRAQKDGGQTLVDSGLLAASITAHYTHDSITLSSDRVYAAIQHYGGTIDHPGGTPYVVIGGSSQFLKKDGDYPPGTRFTRPHTITIDARPYLVIQDEDYEDIADVVAEKMGR